MAVYRFVFNCQNGLKIYSIPAGLMEQYYGAPPEKESYTFYTVKTGRKIIFLDEYAQKKRDSLRRAIPQTLTCHKY